MEIFKEASPKEIALLRRNSRRPDNLDTKTLDITTHVMYTGAFGIKFTSTDTDGGEPTSDGTDCKGSVR